MTTLNEMPPNRAILLANVTCPYCGSELNADRPGEKEHVIGRRFVPKGILDGQWNLIVQACRRCNGDKANLENDLSIISMHPNAWGELAVDDPRLRAEVERKAARAISRRTGKPVAHGEEALEIKGQWGPASFGFKFDMPPQAAEERIFELARMQVAAFFYWITFDTPSSEGGFMPGDFAPLNETRKPDWGNPQSLWFMQTTASWDWRIHAIGADGFFKLAMKKKSETEHIWSWALEWNHNLRVCGFFGDPALIDAIAQGIPTLEMTTAQRSPKHVLRYRKEVSLEASNDTMFTLPQVVDAELTR